SIEHGTAGNRGKVGAMAIGDPAQYSQQLLEKRPAAEVVDDQLVFSQRAILERIMGLGDAKPAIREEATGDRAVTQELDVVLPAKVHQSVLWPTVDKRILDLH